MIVGMLAPAGRGLATTGVERDPQLVPVLRLHLDELTLDVATDDDLETIRAAIRRDARELAVSAYRTTAGHPVLINWRAVRTVRILLVDEHQGAAEDPRRGSGAAPGTPAAIYCVQVCGDVVQIRTILVAGSPPATAPPARTRTWPTGSYRPPPRPGSSPAPPRRPPPTSATPWLLLAPRCGRPRIGGPRGPLDPDTLRDTSAAADINLGNQARLEAIQAGLIGAAATAGMSRAQVQAAATDLAPETLAHWYPGPGAP